MKDLVTSIIAIFIVIIAFVALLAFMAWSVYWLDVYRCNQKYPDFERKQNGFYARCMIKVNDKWIPAENYRNVEE